MAEDSPAMASLNRAARLIDFAKQHFGEKCMNARAGSGVFNLFSHFDPRDVQNSLTSARFGGFFNSSWREYRGKFALEL
jgi:hypothetical protein